MTNNADRVRQAQSRDRSESHRAFDCLARDYRGMVYAIAYTRVSDSQLAEDIVQEAFITAWMRIAQLKDAGAFPAWMRRITLTQADRIHRAEAGNGHAGGSRPRTSPTTRKRDWKSGNCASVFGRLWRRCPIRNAM